MHETTDIATAIAALKVGATRSGKASGMATLTPLHRETMSTMPVSAQQEIRVIYAELMPGDVTPHHSHRFPVTVFMTEGIFTLELDGQAPIDLKAGDVFVEPSGVQMTGRNSHATSTARMALFYVCEPDSPFADLVQPQADTTER